jgi:3-methyladenine DNA glycosylase/8-oxoguanine DNA glycosylase
VHTLAVELSKDPTSLGYLRDDSLSSEEVKKKLLAIKGVGNYAAASLLMLLGRYDDIPVDSVFRQLMREKYFKETEFELSEALSLYQEWGKWKYLAYWFDLLDFYHTA